MVDPMAVMAAMVVAGIGWHQWRWRWWWLGSAGVKCGGDGGSDGGDGGYCGGEGGGDGSDDDG